MMCISPITVKVGKHRARYEKVPCGKCYACKSKDRTGWSLRLEEELRNCDLVALFITLTYATPPPSGVNTRDVQLWLKRLRKALPGRNIKYFLTSEYGSTTNRPHYHCILFGLLPTDHELILHTWNHGFVHVGTATPQSIGYVVKYLDKDMHVPEGCNEPFRLMSKGLGRSYVERMLSWHQDDVEERVYVPGKGGTGRSMPRYYKNKIYNEIQRKHLSAQAEARFMEEVPDTLDEIRSRHISHVQEGERRHRRQYEKRVL